MSDPTPETVADGMRDAVAWLRAHLAGDEQAAGTILEHRDPLHLLAAVTAFALQLGAEALQGADVLDEYLRAWQRHQIDGEVR